MRQLRRRRRLRTTDGPVGIADPPAGDVDYARYGIGYAGHRRTDPRIARLIRSALGPLGTVLNVGAGAGSYEPADRPVIAVEPAEAMVAQRPQGSAPVIRAVAGALPLADAAVATSMATVTIHQWPDPLAGLGELRRVTVGPVVVLTFDPGALDRLWLAEYSPELYAAESRRYPSIDSVLRPWATGPPLHLWPCPSTAWTASPKPSTDGPRHSSTPPCDGRSRPGASWKASPSPGLWITWPVTWPRDGGTNGSVTYGTRRSFVGSLRLVIGPGDGRPDGP